MAEYDRDPATFLARADDLDPVGCTVTLADGTAAPRLPGFARWMWTAKLRQYQHPLAGRHARAPPDRLGHVEDSAAPWKQRRGYATEALRQLLASPELAAAGLPYVEITTNTDNLARVAEGDRAQRRRAGGRTRQGSGVRRWRWTALPRGPRLTPAGAARAERDRRLGS